MTPIKKIHFNSRTASLRRGFLLLVIFGVSACGGGGGSVGVGVVSPVTEQFQVFSPSATTLAAKKLNSPLVFAIADVAVNQGCGVRVTNSTVYEQAHTVVFAAAEVTEAEQQEVAEYAEAAVVDIRRTFPTIATTSAVGFNNEKLFVCVQTQSFNNTGAPAAASRNFNGTGNGGIVIVQGANAYFNAPRNRSSIANEYGKDFQAIYRRTLAHESLHVMEQIKGRIIADAWFTEGIARYFEFGKPAQSISEISTKISANNPLNSTQTSSLTEYSSPAAVMAYLFAPNGANNPLSAYTSMLETMRLAEVIRSKNCDIVAVPAATCPITAAERETFRSTNFTAAFEAHFKERDGSAMRLYTGINSLKSTLLSRITTFW